MNNLKITKGVWKLHKDSKECIVMGYSGNCVVSYNFPILVKEIENNALLIAEAGTVANETGLMPREMADKIKELEIIIEELRRGK